MIRTVWLAVLCLALVSALAAGKALRTPAPAIAERPADQITVGIDRTPDTLSKADRLEINYISDEPPPPPAPQPITPAAPVVAPPAPPIQTRIISRHWRDPHATSSSLKASERTESRTKSKNAERKRNQAADRSKPPEPVKPCSRPGALGDLLRAVNLSPACAS